MNKVTIEQLRKMSEEQFSEMIQDTIESKPQHDFYLDKLTTGQFMISYGEHPLQVYDNLQDARAAYFAKLDHI